MKRIIYVLILVGFIAAAVYAIFFRDKVMPLTQSWETPIPHQEIPEGLVSLKSEDCGVCHQEHYAEWKLATHAHAWTDLQFQAELQKESSPFMCINCHIPLQNQQEEIVTGLINGDIYRPVKERNPFFDPVLQQEGINCASCHVRNNEIIGTQGTGMAPHKVKVAPELLSENLCISCHNANAVITPTLACTFETGDEWKAGPFYGEKNCKDCHMEDVERSIVPGFPVRKSHRHFFSGSGIPKFDSVKTTMLNGYNFYPDKLAKSYLNEEAFIYKLRLKNENAGHKVPTGDPERFFLIELTLSTETGKLIKTEKYRIGEEWEWYPEAKKMSDNNMLPGEERTFKIQTDINQKGTYILKAKVTKHRLNKENAEYNKLGEKYPLFVTVFEELQTFNVD
ncbi:multiheme c-type cytochrome [Arcticibacterium luteifluviistationis]|uniref:Cytochrome C554 and C-prime n=1 Tax=Arcticibacterium luteifluviistationis TaxID=1784714 RepID=A0A2Z4GD66_9BACT|nr:multiheme c-type cytochrome [Arcticibacterium luteifluviistationis]AWV98853.1 cytochrome C554 and C-prime [Arcticibacterium luteifluviistationis]